MNVCRFSMNELNELDMIVKRELRNFNMLDRQSSDERLYLSRDSGGRGMISLRDVYLATKARVACYMAKSTSKWIRTAWERECASQYCSIRRDAEVAMREIGCVLEFRGNEILCDGECLAADWKKCWRRLKQLLKKKIGTKRVSEYKLKEMQSEVFIGQQGEPSLWLQCDLDPKKTAAIIKVQEQMIETKAWKVLRGISSEGPMFRWCGS